MVREVRARSGQPVWRREGDTDQAFALVLTRHGRAAIPAENPEVEPASPEDVRAPSELCVEDAATECEPEPLSRPIDPGAAQNLNSTDRPASNRRAEASRSAPRPGSKLGAVLALLGRDMGASVDEIVAATGWLPHTTRAALTNLRRRGFVLARAQAEAGSVYRLDAGPSGAA